MKDYEIEEVMVKRYRIHFGNETAYRLTRYSALQWLAKKITVSVFNAFCNNLDWQGYREFYDGYKRQVYSYLCTNTSIEEIKIWLMNELKNHTELTSMYFEQ
jgi:hypothetical protein